MVITILTLLILFVIFYFLLRKTKSVVSTTTTTNPTTNQNSTTILETVYYGYKVHVYECAVCNNIPIQSNLIVQDTHDDLLLNRYYSDSITGYVFKIMDTNQLIGGQLSNMVGSGRTSCKFVECV